MQARAGVGDGDAEDLGQLRVVEPRVELERDQVAVARRDGGQRSAHGGAAQRALEEEKRALQEAADALDALTGEVSQVNDDNTEKRFYEPVYRFPEIEEDEPPYRLLCNEYPAAE